FASQAAWSDGSPLVATFAWQASRPDSFLPMAFSFAAVHLSATAVPAVSARQAATARPSATRWVRESSIEGGLLFVLARQPVKRGSEAFTALSAETSIEKFVSPGRHATPSPRANGVAIFLDGGVPLAYPTGDRVIATREPGDRRVREHRAGGAT